MNHPFYEEHDQAIEYGEFCECGWSVDQYITYCDIVAQFRAALITEVEGGNVTHGVDVSGEKMKDLLQWVGQACARLEQ